MKALQLYWRVFSKSLDDPPALFDDYLEQGEYLSPLRYAVLCGSIGIMCSLFWQYIDFRYGISASLFGIERQAMGVLLSKPDGIVKLVALVVLSPLIMSLWLFLSCGLIHLGLRAFGWGQECGIKETFRAIAFAQGPIIFIAIPVLGGAIVPIWILIIQVIGLSRLHMIKWWQALIAIVIIPGLFSVLLAGLMTFVALETSKDILLYVEILGEVL